MDRSAELTAVLEHMLRELGIADINTFYATVKHDAESILEVLSSETCSEAARNAIAAEERLHSEMSTMADTVVQDVATQTALTGDVVDVSTAEAMVEEALCMVAEAEEGE